MSVDHRRPYVFVARQFLDRTNVVAIGQQVWPMQDDANLHDVRFVSTKFGWAVGDHGVIWKTVDGGRNWELVPSPVTCPLRHICFLTDRIGWIAGGGIVPYTRLGYGVLLFTEDGGRNWRVLAADRRGLKNPRAVLEQIARTTDPRSVRKTAPWARLPALQYVKFFGLKIGVAVGDASREFPTGVMTTVDGGRNWQPVVGRQRAGWRAAEFIRPSVGVAAGMRGEISLIGSGRMLKPAIEDPGLRAIRDITLQSDDSGWMVGDGGLVRRTGSGGVTWKDPAGPLPPEVRDLFNFKAVARKGKHVWIAGSPGSVVWHSNNDGRTWTKQFTGQTVPIHALSFPTESVGWAVGAMGTMLYTNDGGQTWFPIRGKGRRAAMMTLHGRADDVSFPLIVKQSADLGYRSVVLLPARADIGPDGHTSLDLDLRLSEAVTIAGGSAGSIGWRFPVAIPGIEHDQKKLTADWNRRAEGRLRETMLGGLVARIRTWRPDVIVIDKPAANDAVTNLLNSALVQAVRLAGDPTAFIKQSETAGLNVWKVSKVYWRLPAGDSGHTHVSPLEYLPRLHTTVQFAASHAAGRIHGVRTHSATREAYRLILDRVGGNDSAVHHDFFTGIAIAPGSAARRMLLPWNDKDAETQQKLAKKQRNFQAFAEKALDDPRVAAQMIAQLDYITDGMNPQQAALQILQLAEDYKRRSQWELAEAAMIELVSRYPTAPAAIDGMQWLFQLWTGAEPVWQRVRKVKVGRRRMHHDLADHARRFERAKQQLGTSVFDRDVLREEPDPLQYIEAPESNKIDRNDERRLKGVRHWNDQALKLASLIRKVDTEKYQSPEIQFPLAALLRARGAGRVADRSYRRYQLAGKDDPWKQTADSELWMLAPNSQPPKTVNQCKPATSRPVLDGVLADECWVDAKSMPLTPSKDADPVATGGYVQMSYDREYLYLAGNIPRAAGLPRDMPVKNRTRHDADVSRFDRVSFFIDVDRDYATYYTLTIDQRGFAVESCFGDKAWNPKWYVAVDANEKSWRFEAAIPLSELVPRAPGRNHAWAIGVVRTMPAIGLQSWTHPAGATPRPESFGLLRFE
eukprot:g18353.t1